jgi:hypothetical protein
VGFSNAARSAKRKKERNRERDKTHEKEKKGFEGAVSRGWEQRIDGSMCCGSKTFRVVRMFHGS